MSTPAEATEGTPELGRAPREDLVRALPRAIEHRAKDDEGEEQGEILTGHFAVTNTWTEINSMWEGRFLERFAPGAFKKTIRERGDAMRVLFQHGMDPEVGDKPIASIVDLREDDEGAFYEARMLDGVPELIMAGLRAGLYGASFRFSVMREEWAEEPGVSDYNPEGLPERTVKEARVAEFGPVTFGAYPQASAGFRSQTDNFLLLRSSDSDARRLLLSKTQTVPMLSTRSEERAAEESTADAAPAEERSTAPSESDAANESHLTSTERREPSRQKSGKLTPEDFRFRGRRTKDDPPWRI